MGNRIVVIGASAHYLPARLGSLSALAPELRASPELARSTAEPHARQLERATELASARQLSANDNGDDEELERTVTVNDEEAPHGAAHQTLVLSNTANGVTTPVGGLIVERSSDALDPTFAEAITAGLSDFTIKTTTAS